MPPTGVVLGVQERGLGDGRDPRGHLLASRLPIFGECARDTALVRAGHRCGSDSTEETFKKLVGTIGPETEAWSSSICCKKRARI